MVNGVVMALGFTEITQDAKFVYVTHNGNMGNTVKRSVEPNVDTLLGKGSFSFLESHGKSAGDPSYMYWLEVSRKHCHLSTTNGITSLITNVGENIVKVQSNMMEEIKAKISNIANMVTFEFNDDITRSNVREYFKDFMADNFPDVDFRVVCDHTNNSPQLIDDFKLQCDFFVLKENGRWTHLNLVAYHQATIIDKEIAVDDVNLKVARGSLD